MLSLFSYIELVDDADDRRIDRRTFFAERFASRTTLEHRNDELATPCTDRINRQERGGRHGTRRRPLCAPLSAPTR